MNLTAIPVNTVPADLFLDLAAVLSKHNLGMTIRVDGVIEIKPA